jgi:transforming growth factor-beta-induced protein
MNEDTNLSLPPRTPGMFGGIGGLGNFGGLDLGEFSSISLDPFSMFGSSRRSWWRGENVCMERDVIEEGDERETEQNNHGFGIFQMNMQMTQCRDDDSIHQCTTTMTENGVRKTVVVTYSCCHGHQREQGRGGCTAVHMTPLRETVEELGGEEFLTLLEQSDLMGKLNENMTIFVPTDDAIQDFNEELVKMNVIAGSGNIGEITYNIDDGLMSRRRRQVAITDLTETPRLQDIMLAHMTPGFVDTIDMRDESTLVTETPDRSSLRLTVYNTFPQKVIMANCAKIISRNNIATNGIVHMVDKVIMPSLATVADVLSQDLMFQTFYSALEASGLTDKLSEEGQFTVFAPTDQAFEKLDAKIRDKILSGNGCAQDILKNHLLPNVICSGVIEGRAKTNNLLDRYVVLDRDEEGNVLVEGVQLIVRDIMGTNGVIHVIEDVLIPDSARDVPEAFREKNMDTLLELFEAAGLTESMGSLSNMTIFAPSEKALSDLPAAYLENLKNDPVALTEFLMYHVTEPKKCKCDLNNNLELQSGVSGKKVRLNNYGSSLLFGDRSKVITAQCSKLVDLDNQVCGGFIHTVDKVLLPPAGDLMTIIRATDSHSRFLELLVFAELEDELTSEIPHTILVPTDDAFDDLDEAVRARMFEEKDIAEKVIKKHIVREMICCAGIQRNVFLFNSARRRSALGEVISLRRSNGGHIFADKAPISKCDMVADNGVAHAIDEVLLPRELQPERDVDRVQSRRNVFRSILDPFNIF